MLLKTNNLYMKSTFHVVLSLLALLMGAVSCDLKEGPASSGQGGAGDQTIHSGEYLFMLENALSEHDGKLLFSKDASAGVLSLRPQMDALVAEARVSVSEGGVSVIFNSAESEPLAAGDSIFLWSPYSASRNGADLLFTIPSEQKNVGTSLSAEAMPQVSQLIEVDALLPSGRKDPAGVFRMVPLGALVQFDIYSTYPVFAGREIAAVRWESDGLCGSFTCCLTSENHEIADVEASGDQVTLQDLSGLYVGGSAKEPAHALMAVLPGKHSGKLYIITEGGDEIVFPLNDIQCSGGSLAVVDVNLESAEFDSDEFYADWEPVIDGQDTLALDLTDAGKIAVYGNGQAAVTGVWDTSKEKFATDQDVEGPYCSYFPYSQDFNIGPDGVFHAEVPAVQRVPAGCFMAQEAMTSFASGNSPLLKFYNTAAFVKVALACDGVVTSIKLNAGELPLGKERQLAGKYAAAFNSEGELEVTKEGAGSDAIELIPEAGTFDEGTYYIAVLPEKHPVYPGVSIENDCLLLEFATIDGDTFTREFKVNGDMVRNKVVDAGLYFGYNIDSAASLLKWNKAETEWTKYDVVTLAADIDCAGVITSDDWTIREFEGRFDGKGRIIDNLKVTRKGHVAFFRSINGSACVSNLVFGEGCSFTAESAPSHAEDAKVRVYAAGLACVAKGSSVIDSVIFKGAVNATSAATDGNNGNYVGGICSSFSSDAKAVDCENHGKVTFSAVPGAWMNCGGIFGEVTGDSEIENCRNYGEIIFNGKSNGGNSINMGGISAGAENAGFIGCTNLGRISCNTSEAGTGRVNIGGIVGHNNNNALASVISCVNGSAQDPSKGELLVSGTTSGEICVGGCIGFINKVRTDVSGFTNYGKICNQATKPSGACIGGVVGRLSHIAAPHVLQGCVNHGPVSLTAAIGGGTGGIGGILGAFNGEVQGGSLTIKDCVNAAKVERAAAGSSNFHVGGIAGAFNGAYDKGSDTSTEGYLTGCTNTGEVVNGTASYAKNSYTYTGGVIGYIRIKGEISGCVNEGLVLNRISTHGNTVVRVGGIAGGLDCGKITKCTNKGTVRDDSTSDGGSIGGITGCIKTRPVYMEDCVNEGDISGVFNSAQAADNIYMGGIVGRCEVDITGAVNCENSGNLRNVNTTGNTKEHIGGIVASCTKKAVFSGCKSVARIVPVKTTYEAAGAFAGKLDSAASSVLNCSVGGVFAGITLTEDNFKQYFYGTASVYRATSDNLLEILEKDKIKDFEW